ncbi:DinB family protein [Paenibacillus sp. MMS18-CY102]|uniref:DinB family protein n=1 Tax=Paenibacillus sp. MMS18-CY102 TaxID=2682849 RepID=UPI0013665615|nr:DinB family protein [Paenibacillus sp. MMS18-CY102]MWC27142.1 DinB family protein [Paenibacillus sp. MMS18-CY102]
MNISSTIDAFEQFAVWTNQLVQRSDQEWRRPINEGKASVAEVIAHLRNWDLHLIDIVIPSVRRGEGMEFPDFDAYNARAYEYANSGIRKDQLLEQFASDRMRLVKMLREMKPEEIRLEVPANGVANCPKTGTPYSLIYIIHEFVEHDLHHKGQIASCLET